MSDDLFRVMLASAVEKLRGASDLTMNEIVGLRVLPESSRTPEIAYALGTIEGAAMALRCTPHELLEDLDLLVAAKSA